MLERLSVEPRRNLQPGVDRLMPPVRPAWSRSLGSVLVALIRVYQLFVSPLLGACCRFEPSCSRYTIACIERGGPLRGVWWGARRLCRCHPFCAGGYDPPPEFSA